MMAAAGAPPRVAVGAWIALVVGAEGIRAVRRVVLGAACAVELRFAAAGIEAVVPALMTRGVLICAVPIECVWAECLWLACALAAFAACVRRSATSFS